MVLDRSAYGLSSPRIAAARTLVKQKKSNYRIG